MNEPKPTKKQPCGHGCFFIGFGDIFKAYKAAVFERLVNKNEMQGNSSCRTTNQDEKLIKTIFAKYLTVIKSNGPGAA